MTWVDDYAANPASFRGVPFSVRSDELSGGQRHVIHRFPGRDDVEWDAMGRDPRKFRVDGLVLGANYWDARNKIVQALEKAGPGELVHPYWGRQQVVVSDGWRVRQSTNNGGAAFFSFSCTVVGKSSKLQGSLNIARTVKQDAADLRSALVDTYGSNVDTSQSAGGLARSKVLTMANDAVSSIRSVNSRISAATTVASATESVIDSFSDEVSTLILTPASFATAALGVVDEVFASVAQIENAFGRAVSQTIDALETMAAFGGFTDRSTQVATNQNETTVMVRGSALAAAGEQAAGLTFFSARGPRALMASLASVADSFEDRASDEVFEAMQALRADLAHLLEQQVVRLPDVATYTPPRTLPALVVSQMVYGDASRDEEIVERNGLLHPAYVPPEPIEVIRG